jgi:hypothetical protein
VIEHVPILSTNILSAGYDPEQHVMEIAFRGGVYAYEDVPQEVFDGLVKSPSAGQFFNENIRFAYRYRRS